MTIMPEVPRGQASTASCVCTALQDTVPGCRLSDQELGRQLLPSGSVYGVEYAVSLSVWPRRTRGAAIATNGRASRRLARHERPAARPGTRVAVRRVTVSG